MLVIMPGCWPGSNQVGAIETWTAQVIWLFLPPPHEKRSARQGVQAPREELVDGPRSEFASGPSFKKLGPINPPSPCSVNCLSDSSAPRLPAVNRARRLNCDRHPYLARLVGRSIGRSTDVRSFGCY